MWFGYYVQMVAAFLLLALSHYFAAAFLPVADCDETFNYLEPMHFLLFRTGKQTWEYCNQFALRSFLFNWLFAAPAAPLLHYYKSTFTFHRAPAPAIELHGADIYFFLRILHGRLGCLCELFFVYSVWSVFSGKCAMVALLLLLANYAVPHAAVSVLPTSFAMSAYFVTLGCWMRSRAPPRAAASSSCCTARLQKRLLVFTCVFTVVAACALGWPFAGLVAAPIALDLLLRCTRDAVASLALSLALVLPATYVVDTHYYCRPVLSTWNIIRYNMLSGKEGRGPELYGVEPWYFFFKNMLLNHHLVFLSAAVAPFLVAFVSQYRDLCLFRTVGRRSVLLFISPFYLWFAFWLFIPHKEERFMSPAFPFLILAATVAVSLVFFPDTVNRRRFVPDTLFSDVAPAPDSRSRSRAASRDGRGVGMAGLRHRPAPAAGRNNPRNRRSPHRLLFVTGLLFLLAHGAVNYSRAMAVYTHYGDVQRLLYDTAPALQRHALALRDAAAGDPARRLTLCVGKEWYRFPSSFFLDHQTMQYRFIRTRSFDGMLPIDFPAEGSCGCAAPGMNDLNRATPEQYVRDVAAECDAVLDSLPDPRLHAEELREESAELHLDSFPHRLPSVSPGAYHLLDVRDTPLWCRVLYYPFGLTQRCSRNRSLVLAFKRPVTEEGKSVIS